MNRLTQPQAQLLNLNTIASIENGFASRYHSVIREDLNSAEEFLAGDECVALELDDEYREYAEKLGSALMAEVPLVFYFEPSNLTRSVFVAKISPETGKIFDQSRAFIGLIGGLAGVGRPHFTFEAEHLDFAVNNIQAQEKTGLEIDF